MVNNLKNKLCRAFSLAEVSIVLAVIGALICTSIPVYSYIKNDATKLSDEIKMHNIQIALKEYFAINNRLPKPASIKLARNNDNYGIEKNSVEDTDLSVDGTFHTTTNAFIQDTTIENNTTELPSTYQELEYIETTGSQYIDTGFKPNSNTKLEFKINFTKTDGHFLAHDGTNKFGFYYNAAERLCLSVANNEPLCTLKIFETNRDWYIEIYQGMKVGENADDMITYFTDATTFTVNQNFGLFAMLSNDAQNYFAKAKLYYFKIYNNGTLIRHFIPCYRKSDGKVGMYDIINNVFYTNGNTSTTFNKGPINQKLNVKYIMFRGIIPFKDLKLNESDVIDSAGNFFEYYVPEIMTLKNYSQPYSSERILYKTGYKQKILSNGKYFEYPCVSKKDSTPEYLCEKNYYNQYGVLLTETQSNAQANVDYIQQPYGLRVRNIEIENQTIQYNEDKNMYLPQETKSYIDNNGDIAYVIVSHGANGEQTCAIRPTKLDNLSPIIISKLTNCSTIGQSEEERSTIIDQTLNNCAKTQTSRYEAQNCFNVEENERLLLIGREKFLDKKHHEVIFYQGKKNKNFDDIVVYTTLQELLDKNINNNKNIGNSNM